MKKYLLIIISILLITGCGKKDTMDIFNNVINNNIDNVKMSAKIEALTLDNLNISMNTNVSLKISENELTFISDIEKNTLTDNITVYGNLLNEKLSLYVPSQVIDNSSEYNCIVSLDKLIENDISIFKINKLITSLKDTITKDDLKYIDKKGKVYHYELKLTDNLLSKMYDEIDGRKEEILKEPVICDIYVDTKTNRVTKITSIEAMALTQFSSDKEFKNVQKLSFTLEFIEYNKIEVDIPNNIIDNALSENTYKQMISLNKK